MKRLILALLLVALSGPAWGQTAETAAQAYARGDLKAAWRDWWALAQKGDAAAQYQIGLMYGSGTGVKADQTEAAKWYRKAAEQGHDKAQAALGLLYSTGMGVPLDKAKAVEWYRKAARQGNADARFNLGLSHWNGDGTTQNFEEASGLFRKTAPAGSPHARSALGTLYEGKPGRTSGGTPAPPGLVQDSTALGAPYGTPTGQALTPAQLFRYHLGQAQRGDAKSQSQLGYMYGSGYGTSRNLIEAHKWSNIAAARLPPGEVRDYSMHNRNAAAVMMTPDQIIEAQTQAREWQQAFETRTH